MGRLPVSIDLCGLCRSLPALAIYVHTIASRTLMAELAEMDRANYPKGAQSLTPQRSIEKPMS